MSQVRLMGESVAGSPYAVGEELYTPNNHQNVTVSSVDSVWRSQRNVGWVYHGSDKQQYFQPDYEYGTKWTVGVDGNDLLGGLLKGLGKLNPLKWLHAEYQSNNGVGDVDTLHGQTQGATVLPGGVENVPDAGKRVPNCPFVIGETLPNGTKNGTYVTDINAITIKGRPVGFMYRAGDGHRYIQSYNGNGSGVSLGPGVKGLGVDAGEGLYGPVERFNGMLPPGAELQRSVMQRERLVGEGMGG